MTIQINGNGTITGISVGGLPDGIVDTDMLAANSVATAKIASGAINASKLSDFFSSGAITLGGIRIVTGKNTTSSSANSTSTNFGVSTHQYNSITITGLTGFASAPKVFASIDTDYHEANIAGIKDITTSSFIVMYNCSRAAGITSRDISWLAIGEAS